MKRNYIYPTIRIIQIKTAKLICASKDITSDIVNGYGGVDEEGEMEPSSREFDEWDDEDYY